MRKPSSTVRATRVRSCAPSRRARRLSMVGAADVPRVRLIRAALVALPADTGRSGHADLCRVGVSSMVRPRYRRANPHRRRRKQAPVCRDLPPTCRCCGRGLLIDDGGSPGGAPCGAVARLARRRLGTRRGRMFGDSVLGNRSRQFDPRSRARLHPHGVVLVFSRAWGTSWAVFMSTALLLATSSYSAHLDGARYVRLLQPDGDKAVAIALAVTMLISGLAVLTRDGSPGARRTAP